MISLFLATLALAATPLWSLDLKGTPEAAFFDASSGSIFVSVRDKSGEGGRIVKVSQKGKLENDSFAVTKGPPGPLRAFDGKIYWIAGNLVQSKGTEGVLTEGTIATELGTPTDIAVDRRGTVYVGTNLGNLVRISQGSATSEQRGQPITGIFLTQDTLQILRGTRLQSIVVSSTKDPESHTLPFFCEKLCEGLERTSAGKWLTVNGRNVVEVGTRSRNLYQASSAKAVLGRPAYVYQMNPDDDFFVVPFPADGAIRAFRVNAARK